MERTRPARRILRQWRRPATLALLASWTILAAVPPRTAIAADSATVTGDTALEQHLPDTNQVPRYDYEGAQNPNIAANELIFVGSPAKGGSPGRLDVKVIAAVSVGANAGQVAEGDTIPVQCWNLQLTPGKNYLFETYRWGNTMPANLRQQPVEIGKDYRDDPHYKVMQFTLGDHSPTDPAAFTKALCTLYKALPGGDTLSDSREEILAFAALEHPERLDPADLDLKTLAEDLLKKTLAQDNTAPASPDKASLRDQEIFERRLYVIVKLYALRSDLKPADLAAKLLAATPLGLRAFGPLIEHASVTDKDAIAQLIQPLLKKALDNHDYDRQEIQLLYLAQQLKSPALTNLIAAAVKATPEAADATLVARTWLELSGSSVWPDAKAVMTHWDDRNANGAMDIWIHLDFVRLAAVDVGSPAYVDLTSAIRASPQLKQMVFQIYNELPQEVKRPFGFALVDAGVHTILQFMLSQDNSFDPRLIEYAVRYAVGEVHSDDPTEVGMLMGATATAKMYLQSRLKIEIASREQFNDWYMQRLAKVNLPLTPELQKRLPVLTADLASPRGDLRSQAQKELIEMGNDALPALLALEHGSHDLTTRQTVRAMILSMPLLPQAFDMNN
ncbi:MAG: hypothetical protein ACREJ2_05595 [Planctomycetota bacterium]